MKRNMPKVSRMKDVVAVCAVMIFVMSFLLLAGCKKRAVTQPETTPPPQATEKSESMQQQKAAEKITEQPTESVTSRDTTAAKAKGEEGRFADILFDYDKYDIKENYKSEVQSISAWMMKNNTATISVEGHCDERGTNEYNLALGDRRAKSVKDLLISSGVPSSRIETISYGEEKPLCTEQTENCWAKNRRAHFVILMKAGK